MPLSSDADPRPSPRLLAIDTAGERLTVAVIAGAQEALADEPGGARASQRLLPLVFELLDAADLGVGELQAIAFGRGPGAFTGLRSACSVAQGLALGLGCPVLALDSLSILAEHAFAHHGARDLWVAVDARMDELYAARYRREGAAWHAQPGPALWTLPALAAAWHAEPPHCRRWPSASGCPAARPCASTRRPIAPARWRAWRARPGPAASGSMRRMRCRCTCATRWR
jgi:tRNA threonylcarbamoyl adenosine modification protein YeaZ